ncbi:MAG: AraC family transcriptional regulator [Spirochaetaceae bacterium]|nr:MAG: AraC family transcriptional regulator [Spirochaetaceae bacterium]
MKRRLLTKWLLTYLAFILVSVTFIAGTYLVYLNGVTDNLRRTNESYLQQIVNHFNYTYQSLNQLAYSLARDPRITRITNLDSDISAFDRFQIYNLHNSLSLLSVSNSGIDNISLYASRADLLLTVQSAYFGDLIELRTRDAYHLPAEDFRSLIHNRYDQKVIRLADWSGARAPTNPLLYIQTIPTNLGEMPRGAVIFQINEQVLGAWGQDAWFLDSIVLVRNDSGNVVYTNREHFYTAVETYLEAMNRSLQTEISLDGRDYFLFHETDARGWSYASFVPRTTFMHPINNIGRIALLTLFLFFGVNLILAYFFANRMYQPVKKLMISINDSGMELDQSEYEAIEQTVTKSRSEQLRMKTEIETQTLEIQQAFLSRALRGFIHDPDELQKKFTRYGIVLSDAGYKILLLRLRKSNTRFNESGVPRFLAQNLLEEILSPDLNAYAVEIEDRIALIVSPVRPEGSLLRITAKVQSALDMLRDNFQIIGEAGISQTHRSVLTMSTAYHESLEAVQNSGILEDAQIIQHEELQELKALYKFDLEDEYKLFHFIKRGDLEQAVLHIDAIIQQNRETHQIKMGFLQCLMFDLVSAIIKSVHHEVFYELINQNDPVQRMMKADSLDTMKEVVLEVVSIACEVYADVDSDKQSTNVTERIDTYIRENYSDMNLNVSKIGDVFGVTPAYLSRVYKKETGDTVSRAINTVRVAAAEKMLLETDKGVAEIADEVGYYYSNAFIRFFKSHTGVTPGQYRTLHGKSET